MLTERADDLAVITSDDGVFLDFPPLGSQGSVVAVYGEDRAAIHRAIKALMLLVGVPLAFDPSAHIPMT